MPPPPTTHHTHHRHPSCLHRFNRVNILLATSLLDAAVVASLAFVRRPSQVPLLYALLTLQFAGVAFYDPARKALVPVLVPARDLHLATTIDSFAWSITGALGASVGGVVASRFGIPACFLMVCAAALCGGADSGRQRGAAEWLLSAIALFC